MLSVDWKAWGWKARTVFVLAFVAGFASVVWMNARVLGLIMSLASFFRTKSLAAVLSYLMIYVVASLCCVPLTPLEMFTGFCFGVPFGIVVDILGRLAGAVLSFMLVRFVLLLDLGLQERCSCFKRLKGAAVLRGVGKAVEEQGLRFLVMFNLAYVPVAVKNYGLALVPEVQLPQFVTAIFIVEVPLASIWACLGNAAAGEFPTLEGNATLTPAKLVGDADHGLKVILLVVGLASIVVIMGILHKKVSTELRLTASYDEEWQSCQDDRLYSNFP
eukprot:TRINITY_DN10001_c0_g1_i1.p1 TRINITY_DN10001_c0_g1~~TRINITY_DN10001_c0_g1_i1.p1  ORF type:complete len:274 (+),score=41.35 TRINITY_DN10001_c0_g1_i1:167-988(+)